VSDLERFFRHLVNTLAQSNSARLREPLSLGDIRNVIVPYRTHRRALQLESSEDYELLVMRLCAGEEGLARTSPAEIEGAFRTELRSPNPDLSIVAQHEDASITLDSAAVTRSLDHRPELAFAPQDLPVEPTLPEIQSSETRASDREAPSPAAVEPPQPACSRCGCALPQNRLLNFCPQCGYDLRSKRCSSCSMELDPAWRHCIGCGAAITPLS
jgi:hypothetical protein